MKKPNKKQPGIKIQQPLLIGKLQTIEKIFSNLFAAFQSKQIKFFFIEITQINFISYFWSKNPILHLTSTMEQCKFARNMVEHMLPMRDLAEFVYCS